MAVRYDRMKNPRAAKNQQQGAIRFYLQNEMNKLKIIQRLKNNLEGTNLDGQPYNHRVTGKLEKSITPNKDGTGIWSKNIQSRIKVDSFLGLGIGIDEVSVKISYAKYGDELDQGFDSSNVTQMQIAKWIMMKARKNPTSKWYAYYGNGRVYDYYGSVPYRVAKYIARPIAKKLRNQGYRGSDWASSIFGGTTTEVYTDEYGSSFAYTSLNKKNSVAAAIQRAFMKYLDDYPEYVYGTVTLKTDKLLSKLI